MMRCSARTATALATLLTLATPARADDVLHLSVGDPDRADKTVALLLDGIVDTHDGAVLTPDEAAARLRDVRILFVGESHTSLEFHHAQRLIIEALIRSGRPVLLGLEMFPTTEQPALDRWIDEGQSEEDFIATSGWYEHWQYNWGYYREIFLTAQREGIRMFALNAPRHVVSAVRQKGIGYLSAEEAAYLPPSIDTDNEQHLRLFKAYFGDDDATHAPMTDQQWRAMFAAQCTWDATMGYNAVRAWQEHGAADAIMVVIIGSGHVSYGLGIERQARRFFDGRTATMIPVPMRDSDGRDVDTVSAAYADYVWGIPGEEDTAYPGLGLSTRPGDGIGLAVVMAQPETPGADAGIEAGDVLLSLDGHALADGETYNRLVGAKRWGDVVRLQVRRDGAESTVVVPLRRSR